MLCAGCWCQLHQREFDGLWDRCAVLRCNFIVNLEIVCGCVRKLPRQSIRKLRLSLFLIPRYCSWYQQQEVLVFPGITRKLANEIETRAAQLEIYGTATPLPDMVFSSANGATLASRYLFLVLSSEKETFS